MAKDQNLALNPSKISGNCGRLMCCLKYEDEAYQEKLSRLPHVGAIVKTEDGEGEVDNVEILKEVLRVKIKNGEGFKYKRFDLKDVKVIKDVQNKEEYDLFQSKVKESGRTQQEVVIKAIADLKIASTEEVEELKRLNQMFADILSQLRGATTNINQIARKLHTDGEVPNDSMLYFLNKNILKYRKESERIWQLIRRLISGQIHMEQ